MGKLEYLDALKRAMLGLPPETQAKTLAWYEQRFVDGIAQGRSEESIAEELGDPRKVAVTLRASTHMDAFSAKKNPANAAIPTAVPGLLRTNSRASSPSSSTLLVSSLAAVSCKLREAVRA